MSDTTTPRELIEKWTPGIFGDESEFSKVLAIISTAFLIKNGAIPEDRETRAYMKWYAENYGAVIGDEA